MIHYHGLPITPETAALAAIGGGHAFIAWPDCRQLSLAIEAAQSFAVDNGAFSAWRSGQPISDWQLYYDFIETVLREPGFDFAVIPDVIDGSEADNDALIAYCPVPRQHMVPVWHLHESLGRLERLAATNQRIALGSSGEYASVGSTSWWARMGEAMAVACPDGRPRSKLHGLRMLDPVIFSRLPLASADSTNIGRNIGIDRAWGGPYTPPTKEARALLMRQRIEAVNAPSCWDAACHVHAGQGSLPW